MRICLNHETIITLANECGLKTNSLQLLVAKLAPTISYICVRRLKRTLEMWIQAVFGSKTDHMFVQCVPSVGYVAFFFLVLKHFISHLFLFQPFYISKWLALGFYLQLGLQSSLKRICNAKNRALLRTDTAAEHTEISKKKSR